MSSFIVDLWESIFVPGPTPTILKAANATFAALQAVLLVLLVATTSVHFVILSVLCAGLWWSINWFAAELAVAQKQEQQRESEDKRLRQAQGADAAADTSSDTEVEGTATRTGAAAATAAGEVRHRPAQASPSGTQSSASTEDEWEKVSGSEREKAN
ncbi:hypothetical protein HIM_02522 [Hirsutella minnesotensis 3608]|nr:hypothetical protein HIM_02522 [Hirsutella minnesotensis 3608]